MHARRPIRSFVLRAGRVTAAQERALTELWPSFGLRFRRHPARSRRALRATRAALSGNRIRRRRGDRRAREGAPRDRSRRHRGASGGCGTACCCTRSEAALTNLRIICHDAVEVLATSIADDSFDSILIFFPDPWHKKRHNKRRLIDAAFVALLAAKLKAGGLLRLATDWQDYAEQMLRVGNACERLAIA